MAVVQIAVEFHVAYEQRDLQPKYTQSLMHSTITYGKKNSKRARSNSSKVPGQSSKRLKEKGSVSPNATDSEDEQGDRMRFASLYRYRSHYYIDRLPLERLALGRRRT